MEVEMVMGMVVDEELDKVVKIVIQSLLEK